ncbi:MAG: J domain-containing protein [Haloplanus sp.]
MLPEWVTRLPPWVLAGVAMGVVAALLVAGIFVAGDRFLPPPPARDGHRVDGTDRRRAEIRSYLGTIGERYVEDATVHGESVAFYLPERDVAVTFDPQAFFRLDRTATHAVLCEHEMPGRHLGRRLPFEVPTTRTAVSGSVSEAFARLGLPSTADREAVTAAYRARVKEVHPDHGGDRESFRRLQEAYATARDHVESA